MNQTLLERLANMVGENKSKLALLNRIYQFIDYCRDRYIARIARIARIAIALLLTKDREIGTPAGLAASLERMESTDNPSVIIAKIRKYM